MTARQFFHGSKIIFCFAVCVPLFAQFRGASDWSAAGGDAQRTSWVRTDPKISPASVSDNKFQLIYKLKLGAEPLTAPVILDRYIGYRGFRSYVFAGGSNEDVFALDSDLGRLEWHRHFPVNTAKESGACPGGMTAALTRPVTATFPSNAQSRFGGFGRGGPAKSGVGEPNEGAVTLAQVAANRQPQMPALPAPAAPGSPAARVGTVSANPFAPRPTLMFAIDGSGAVHTMYVSNGEEAGPTIPFLPANANVADFAVVDGIAYATTINHCGGAADGLWALDLTSKAAASWEGPVVGAQTAFSPSNAFIASGPKLISLDQKTLAAGAAYDAGKEFSTAPLAFEFKTKAVIAAATRDGVVHLVDSGVMNNAMAKSAAAEGEPFTLATWETAASNRWIIETSPKAITAWKLKDDASGVAFAQGWTVSDVKSPAAPLIVNGVLFVLDRGDSAHHAKLLAFDASSGKELWNSGSAITSFVSKTGGLAAGGSSVYFGTHDGTLWAFGFPIEH